MNYIVEKLHINNPAEIVEVRDFLLKFSLDYEIDIDYTVVIRENNRVIATCSKSKDVLKGFAIEENLQGQGITNLLIKNIQDKLFDEGIFHSFIFTKPEYSQTFQSFGYRVVSSVEEVILLEYGFSGIEKSLDSIQNKFNLDKNTTNTALVMNCNPFTLGHRYLIEKANETSEGVLIFVVEEDRSLFNFRDRYNMVKDGVRDLKNVKVIPGGKYIISSNTFPSYFLREESKVMKAYTKLDATIFRDYFCERFNITRRMLGEEPYCPVTKSYNDSLKEILEVKNIKVEVIPRKWISNPENYISASKVRQLIKLNNSSLDQLSDLIPKTTLEFLRTKEGKEVIEQIKNSNTPH